MQSTSSNNDVVPIKTLSTFQAFILIFKARFAMGLIFIPYYYARIGLVPGSILSICIELYTYYSIQNQVRVKQEICDKLGYKFMSYRYAMEIVTMPKSLVRSIWISYEILLVIQNVMLCSSFTFLISVIASLFVNGTDVFYRLFVLILILPAMIFYQIRTYRTLSYVVMVATLLSIISIGIVLFDILAVGCPKTSLADVQSSLFRQYEEIPLFMASVIFIVSPISVVEAVQTFMENPKRLRGRGGILSITISLNLIILIVIGILGAIVFREKILFNLLEHYLVEDVVSTRLILLFFFISIFITTAIHFNVVFGIIWQHFFEGVFSINQELESEAAVRAILILVTYVLTVCWSHLDIFVPMVGAFCTIPLTFVYPFILEFMIVWPERANHSNWLISKIIVCATFGFSVSIASIVFTILHCYNRFTEKK